MKNNVSKVKFDREILRYDIDDVKAGKTPSRFIRPETIYTSEGGKTTKTSKPNTKAMRAGYSTTAGVQTFNMKKVESAQEIFRKQYEKELERIADIKKNAWKYALKEKLLSFRFANVIPLKVKTFIINLPIMTPKSIYSYLRAEYSNIEQGPVSLPVYEERKRICGECPKRMFPEGYTDPLGFCTECGCGANPRAQLTVKLKLPATSCPLGKWDEASGIYEGLWGRIRYIFTRRRSK
tara:strand:+ start:7399 stop:8109 length:711 start_codon:yes stop_codon:yes gene_type:complete